MSNQDNFNILIDKIIKAPKCSSILKDSTIMNTYKSLNPYLMSDDALDKMISSGSFAKILVEILEYFLIPASSLCKTSYSDKEQEKHSDFFIHFLNLAVELTSISKKFSLKFHEYKGTDVLFKFLNLFTNKEAEFQQFSINEALKPIASIIRNVSFVAQEKPDDFIKLDASIVLINCMHYFKVHNTLLDPMHFYVALVKIIDERSLFTKPECKEALERIIERFKQVVESNERDEIEVMLEIEKKQNSAVYNYKKMQILWSNGWNLEELMFCINLFANIDILKRDIYFKFNLKHDLIKLVNKASKCEKVLILKLLWALCFDISVALDVSATKELMLYIEEDNDENVKVYCHSIMFLIKSFKNKLNKDSKKDKNRIFISYDYKSREISLQIKRELEKNDYAVCMSIDSTENTEYEIEGSKYLLMCINEDYQKNKFCRMEAEYAVNLDCKIIPLKLEANFSPSGWLGTICDSNNFIDFLTYNLNESIQNLIKILQQENEKLNEIEKIRNESQERIKLEDDNSADISENNKKFKRPIDWDIIDVQEWLTTLDIDFNLMILLFSYDGSMLFNLNNQHKSNLELFQEYNADCNIPQHSIEKFTDALAKLFLKN